MAPAGAQMKASFGRADVKILHKPLNQNTERKKKKVAIFNNTPFLPFFTTFNLLL